MMQTSKGTTRRLFALGAAIVLALTAVFTASYFLYQAVVTSDVQAVDAKITEQEEAKAKLEARDNSFRMAKADFQLFKTALASYEDACGQLPTTEQGLDALVKPPSKEPACAKYKKDGFLDGQPVPVDPWDHAYVYASDGKTFTLLSYGADGKEGGEGDDEDIKSY